MTRKDSFWKLKKTKAGDHTFEQVTREQALKNINWHRKTKGVLTSDIFRKTKLTGRTIMPGILKPHMTKSMKGKLAAGLAIAAAGLGGAAWNERD